MIIEIDHKCGIPAYQQVADGVAVRILSGVLNRDEPLPSIKELALQLQVNPNTVEKAYRTLETVGLVAVKADQFRATGGERVLPAVRSDIISRSLRRVVDRARELGIPAEVVTRAFQELMGEYYDSESQHG